MGSKTTQTTSKNIVWLKIYKIIFLKKIKIVKYCIDLD